MDPIKKARELVNSWVTQTGKRVQNNLQVRPGTLTYKALTPVANFQSFVQSPKSVSLPQVPQRIQKMPVVGTVANIGRDITDTIVSKGVINPALDIGRLISEPITGRQAITYDTAKSAPIRLGMNIGALINPEAGKTYGVNQSPQQFIGNAAETAIAPLTAYGGRFGLNIGTRAATQGLTQAIKSSAAVGGVGGGIYGLLNGLAQGRNETLPKQLVEGLKQAGIGSVFGAVAGGVVGTGGYTFGAIRNKLTDLLVQKHGFNPKQARDALGRWAKYDAKRAATGKPPAQNEPVWVGDIRESIGLPRNGNYPELPQPGLSVKYTKDPRINELELISETLGIETPNYSPQPGTFNAAPFPETRAKIKVKNAKAEAQAAKADFDNWQKQVFQQEKATQTTGGAVKQAVGAVKTGTRSPISDPTDLKDISSFTTATRDVFRNFKAVYGKKYDQVKQLVLDPFDRAKGRLIDNLNKLDNELDTNIVKKYGFNKGSKESAAIQQFGEGNKDYTTLVKEFGEKKANDIVEADKWFRAQYNRLLDEVNQSRAVIYPNQQDKIIPKRQDYYRHFREMAEGFQGLLNIFETPAGISSNLSGVSQRTLPKSKFLSFAQKRLGVKTDEDAVGGFIDYAKSAEYAKNLDPQIERFRALAEELRGQTAEGANAGKLNNFIEFLDDFTNDLAGKTNPYDRGLQKIGGRKVFNVLNWVNSRVKANVIIGNLRSSISQIFNVPQGIASAGPVNSSKGLVRAFTGMFDDNNPMRQSTFLKERYNRAFDKFNVGLLDNTKKFAVWITGALDEVGTKYIWNAHYEKALKEGIANPVKYADDTTRSLVAGRGIGEVPLLQKSKAFQLVAPFQLEVANAWWVMKDFVDEKRFGALATMLVANYVFNRGAERITGSDVTFDPIQATIEALGAYNEEEDKGRGALRAGGRITGEVLSNIPLGQTVAGIYPEYGGSVGDTKLPTRKDLFGQGDPTRFGSGLVAAQGITDPLFKLAPPFGGGQIKKTIEGVDAYNQGYSETSSGRVRYPIEKNVRNAFQSAVFGQYSTPDARQYFKEKRTPLGDNQSKTFKTADQPTQVYKSILDKRRQDNIIERDTKEYTELDTQIKDLVKANQKEKAKELINQNKEVLLKGEETKKFKKRFNEYHSDLDKVSNSDKLTPEQKQKLIQAIQQRIDKLNQSYSNFQKQ